MSLFFIQ